LARKNHTDQTHLRESAVRGHPVLVVEAVDVTASSSCLLPASREPINSTSQRPQRFGPGRNELLTLDAKGHYTWAPLGVPWPKGSIGGLGAVVEDEMSVVGILILQAMISSAYQRRELRSMAHSLGLLYTSASDCPVAEPKREKVVQ